MKKIVIVSHSVANYSTWKPKFDAHSTLREEAGIRTIDVMSDFENENNVTLMFETSDLDKFNGFFSSENVQADLAEAGVISEPQVKILISKN